VCSPRAANIDDPTALTRSGSLFHATSCRLRPSRNEENACKSIDIAADQQSFVVLKATNVYHWTATYVHGEALNRVASLHIDDMHDTIIAHDEK
jgi:hypothetical protein